MCVCVCVCVCVYIIHNQKHYIYTLYDSVLYIYIYIYIYIYKRTNLKKYSYFCCNIYFSRPYIFLIFRSASSDKEIMRNFEWKIRKTKFWPLYLPNPNIIIFFNKRPDHLFFLFGWHMTFNSCIKMYQLLTPLSFSPHLYIYIYICSIRSEEVLLYFPSCFWFTQETQNRIEINL